jgi:metallo-beta-lactamase family protein
VRIFGDTFQRKAEVAVLDAFSAHADRDDLIAYARAAAPRRIFLVHGETSQREALAEALREERIAEVHLPAPGDAAEL